MTSRFEESYDLVLKLVQVFIDLVGDVLQESKNLLKVVSELKM